MSIQSMSASEKFISRDLSWLQFNGRVLEEAADVHNPLLERLRFVAIFSNNLDEFMMVRVAGIKSLIASGYANKDSYGYLPQDLLAEINTRITALNKRCYALYPGKLKAEMEKHRIFVRKYNDLTPDQKRYVKKYFESTLFPVVTPIAVDQGRPFPLLPSKTIAFAAILSRYTAHNLAIIPLPKSIPRVLALPTENNEFSFILSEEILRANLDVFFKGYKIVDSLLFRVIRDSELIVNEEYTPDLLQAIEVEVKKRSRAKVMYVEAEKSSAPELLDMLCQGLDFPKEEVTGMDGECDFTYLFSLAGQVLKPELAYPAFVPVKPAYENIFNAVAEGDMLVHLPYQSFQPIVDLLQSSAIDDNVLAIKMTLYRSSEDSAIIRALKEAAKRKKQVTVVVEIKARFDEERNISWVKELEEAGCHVMYGIAGVKIHSKITLVVRKEEERIRRYVHLSTGNYNEKTAQVYTDIGYFTVNDDFAKDISDVFNVITGYSVPSRWKRIISSPYDLRHYFLELIEKEIEHQKRYKNGSITAKMNSLEDPQIIEKLYEASTAGVKIRLLVRGICCLVPGVPNLSENIEVKSIIGRFLEHSRVFVFNNNASSRVFLSSADWMRRNFDRRIELLFELYKDEHKDHIRLIMDTCWNDNVKSWDLLSDRNYVKQKKDGERVNAQEVLMRYYPA